MEREPQEETPSQPSEEAPPKLVPDVIDAESLAASPPAVKHGFSPGGLACLFVPGFVQFRQGERTKGFLYLLLASGTVVLAFAGNRAWLYLFWKLKALNVTRIFLQDYYAAKQHALYLFGFLYLILLVASRVDAMINPCDDRSA